MGRKSKKEEREWHTKRKSVIAQLRNLERRFGDELTRAAMRKHLESVREEDKRLKMIHQLQEELEVLRQKRT